ncbi:hypothetical protein FOCC_FOCC012686 [Frankliniella occidentalis]|nr:hypothetical protein FOCC_FOCC012686 [Frankliniella occidentalis]
MHNNDKPQCGVELSDTTNIGTPNVQADTTFEVDDMNLSLASEPEIVSNLMQAENVLRDTVPVGPTASFHDGIDCDIVSSSDEENWDSDAGLIIDSEDDDLLEYTEDSGSAFNNSDEPLYKGAPITLSQSLLSVLAFSMRHNLNGKSIVDLLKLIALHLRPEENHMKDSLYFFKKHFSHLKAPVILHHFCSVCYSKLKDEISECPNIKTHKVKKTQVSYFLQISLEHQLKTIFKRKDFCQNILSRLSRKKSGENNIEDVYDGQLYKELEADGFFSGSKKHNLTLTWNSDGVPVFKSSKTSMWPMFFVINELPYKMRFKKSNVLIGGIWYGSKPIANMMLEPLIDSLSSLGNGIEVKPYESPEKLTVQCILLAGTADLPAKADFMGLKYPSGSNSCAVCKIDGKGVKANQASTEAAQDLPSDSGSEEQEEETQALRQKPKTKKSTLVVKKKREGSVWVFPYSANLDLRRHEETELHAEQAFNERQKTGNLKAHVLGVKRPTALSKIMPDMIRGMGIDDLHHSYHGVGHKLMELWFLPKFKRMPWSLRKKIDLVDERLKNIQLPNFVQCGVRTVSDLTLWKGKHMKTFLLYLALPVLEGVLPEVYFDHFAILVHCLYILNSSSIAPEDLLHCSQQLNTFVRKFQDYYGERHMTINVHNTLHLAFVVNNLGPMRCYSCFPFESLNGEMLRMIHGTKYVQLQLANCAYLLLSLPYEIECIKSNKIREFSRNLHHQKYHNVKCLEQVNDHIFAAGNYVNYKNVEVGTVNALLKASITVSSCVFFTKLKKESTLFVAQSYCRATKTASYLVSYNAINGKCYGIIKHFIKACHNGRTLFLAAISPLVVQRFSDSANLKSIRHILRYSIKYEVELIDINCLLHICFSVSLKNGDLFLCERMNWLEIE